ncbi:reverse transcriptase domain-containing protein [Tanacetum coccineum]
MKANPKKHVMVRKKERSRHVVIRKGIKPVRKCRSGDEATSPKRLKDVKALQESLALAYRFLSKSMKKSLPFFKTLKRCVKKSDFKWTPEAKRAFQNMKKCIAELPIVTAPKPKEELIMYLCAAMEAVSAVLLTERDLRQVPIYFVNGSSCLEGSGARLILTSPKGEEFTYALRFEFDASNNEAEYEALVAGLRIAEKIGVKNLAAKIDSRLVANEINGLYEAKEQSMTQYLEKTKTLINSFEIFSIEQVPRSENKKVDALSKIASTSFAHLTKQVLVETLKRKSIEEREILAVVEEEGHCWMTPLVKYLAEGTIPAKIKKAHTLKIKARQYIMVNGVLYRKSFLKPWLRSRNLYGTTSCADSSFQEKSYLTTESSSETICSNTSARNSISVNQAENDEGILLNLDILEERREKAAVREARNKAKMEKYYNAKVRSTSFRLGDFVYRSNEASHAKESRKLGLKWEGPYKVAEALRKGVYKLRNGSGDILPRIWNVQDLKKMLSLISYHVSTPANVKPHYRLW